MSISYDDFKKLDLRVANILKIEEISGKTKIVKGEIDLGDETRDVIIGGAEFSEGIIKGSKTLNLKSKDGGSLLEANWDVKMGGLAGMFTGMIKKHIRSGTEQAIESIKKQAENS